MVLPLEGITVVSLEQAVAAPLATRHLADLGARVIKVEPPGSGDFARGYDGAVMGLSSYFVWLNRSKESVALNLRHERCRSLLRELIARADVLVENLSHAAWDRLGLETPALLRSRPELVVCEISGYGNEGPWANRKAYDLLVQCETGLVALTGTPDAPAKVGISIADIAAGMYAFSGILAALFRRNVSGQGGRVAVSMFNALVEWIGAPMYYSAYSGTEPERTGLHHATITPYGPYATRDGRAVVIAVQNEKEWESFCSIVLNDKSLCKRDEFASNPARVKNRDALQAMISARIGSLTAEVLGERLESANIATGEIRTVGQLLEHPVLAGANRVRQVDTPAGPVEALLPPGVPEGDSPFIGPVPAVGQHTEKVLCELGCSTDEITGLAADGAIAAYSSSGLDV